MDLAWFNAALSEFAHSVGASATHRIVLVLDGEGCHRSPQVLLPEGIICYFYHPILPNSNPRSRLWELADEPLVNRNFDSLDKLEDVLAHRCQTLMTMTEQIRGRTYFHWWASTGL